MATVDTTLTNRTRSLPRLEMGKDLSALLERTRKGIDNFLAYPACYGKEGSSETNWVPVDWLGAKLEGMFLGKGGERV